MPYYKFFGGAIALSTENMRAMNGFSNLYYGWGGEDDDSYNRFVQWLCFFFFCFLISSV
jgi:beta-1,4-galactosyltransferase 1